MSLPKLLTGLPPGVKAQRLIPWLAALQVVTPLIKINDPQRLHALPLFENWLRDRDQEISVEQAARLWNNFLSHYARELPARVSQWLNDLRSKDLKNPVHLSRLLFPIWVAMHHAPLKARMQQTFFGRIGYRGLQGSGYLAAFSVFFPLAMVLVGLVTWMLIEVRDPLRDAFGCGDQSPVKYPVGKCPRGFVNTPSALLKTLTA